MALAISLSPFPKPEPWGTKLSADYAKAECAWGTRRRESKGEQEFSKVNRAQKNALGFPKGSLSRI